MISTTIKPEPKILNGPGSHLLILDQIQINLTDNQYRALIQDMLEKMNLIGPTASWETPMELSLWLEKVTSFATTRLINEN